MSDDGFHPFHARCQLSAECTVALLSPRKCDVREAKEMSDGFLLVADTCKGGCLWNGFVDRHHPFVINVCHCSFQSPHENGRKGGNYCSNL